jgi:ribosomal protein L14
MTITLNSDYDVTLSTALLGYVGETNARPVSVEGLTVDGADRYVLTIDYGDGTVYEVDITGKQWTPTADILRSAQTVSCQICAKKLSGQEYILLKKSRIFRLRIGTAIGDTAIPSPDVAKDALDRIDAIGRQAHADMQTAVTAAKTATTMADNATKSATNAGLSADTATQAASRAETAQTSAETSATQAEAAMQGAETARAEAVKSQNSAKVSAAQAATSAQQTTADKNITAGYAKTAKTNADSTAADRQAVQTLAEQVTADKANVAENTAKVAEDRVAAETAAQTAQSIADSLPDDYVTAVGKIAENTAEIANVKLTDKELKRRVDALYSIGQGITHKFETDTNTAYAKTVPTGAKLMSVKNIGGRSIVFNQVVDLSKSKETTADGVTFTFSGDGIVALNGTSNKEGNSIAVAVIKNMKDHKYLIIASPLSNVYGVGQLLFTSQVYGADTTGHGAIIVNGSSNATWYYTLYLYNGVTYDNVKLQPQIFDLTAMFGSGNEPASVEEFEKMFPAAYYPYNAGEIISACTEEVVVGDTTQPILEAIRNLPGYGWSAGTARNYVDYENKKYYQCVQSVDLGMLNWVMGGSTKTVFVASSQVYGQKLSNNSSSASNMLCSKYLAKSQDEVWSDVTAVGIAANATLDGIVYVADSAYTDATAFKQAMQGVMLYYELATPIVTDISNIIPDDFLRNLTVEAGGSITFRSSNDSYRIPVPNEEEYVVKLSEIGGSV